MGGGGASATRGSSSPSGNVLGDEIAEGDDGTGAAGDGADSDGAVNDVGDDAAGDRGDGDADGDGADSDGAANDDDARVADGAAGPCQANARELGAGTASSTSELFPGMLTRRVWGFLVALDRRSTPSVPARRSTQSRPSRPSARVMMPPTPVADRATRTSPRMTAPRSPGAELVPERTVAVDVSSAPGDRPVTAVEMMSTATVSMTRIAVRAVESRHRRPAPTTARTAATSTR